MLPNPRKTKSIRRLGQVNVTALRKKVLALPEDVWAAENADKPNRFDALDKTDHIVFRFVSNFRDWRDSYYRPVWQNWQDVMEPVLRQATAPLGYERGEFPRIMLARMRAGGEIMPHKDANPAAKWPHKIHVPLVTNPDVTFYIEGVGYHLPEGEAVEVNNMGVHSVANRGNSERIHLIFEYFDADQPAPEWVSASQN